MNPILPKATSQAIVERYVDDVLTGRRVVGRLERLSVQRYVADLEDGPARGLVFNVEKAEKAAGFFRFLKHSKGEWAGRELVLSPWQQFANWNLFGWYRADGLRRFRKAYDEVARKNGKSTWAAGLGTYLAFADGEPGAEVYAAATKKDQARIVHSEAIRMVRASSDLTAYIEIYKDSLTRPSRNQKFEPLGADEDTLDGLNVHGSIIDEVHAHKGYGVWDKIETATGARRQPLIFAITTAGVDQATLCWDLHSYARQLLEGTVQDDSFFAQVFTIDEGDRYDNPEVWAKSNPNLGISVKPAQLEELVRKAAKLPAFLNSFLRLHLNVWTQQVKRWLDMDLWDENRGEALTDEQLRGRPCYGGLDLSAVSDITAWVLVFDLGERLYVRCKFWCPEDKLTNPFNKYAEQYQAWQRQGFLETTPGNAIDYQFVKAQIFEDAKQFEMREIAVDRAFQGYQLAMEMADEGLTIAGMGTGHFGMAGPTKEMERRLLSKQLHHGGHPVLRWMAANCAVREDPSGNLKPDKAQSQGKIDGIISTLLALDRHMRGGGRPSVYETRGLLEVGEIAQDVKPLGQPLAQEAP